MQIRPARPSDAPAAAPLIRAAITDMADLFTGSTDEKQVVATLSSFFQQEGNRLSYQHTLVADVAQQAIGLVICYHGQDAQNIDRPIVERLRRLKHDPSIVLEQEAESDEFYIDTLSVAPAYAGQGVGGALLRAAEDWGRKLQHSKISLNVEVQNERALRLYQRAGYQHVKEILIYQHSYFHMVKLLA